MNSRLSDRLVRQQKLYVDSPHVMQMQFVAGGERS
jgi:hypothetical protein